MELYARLNNIIWANLRFDDLFDNFDSSQMGKTGYGTRDFFGAQRYLFVNNLFRFADNYRTMLRFDGDSWKHNVLHTFVVHQRNFEGRTKKDRNVTAKWIIKENSGLKYNIFIFVSYLNCCMFNIANIFNSLVYNAITFSYVF